MKTNTIQNHENQEQLFVEMIVNQVIKYKQIHKFMIINDFNYNQLYITEILGKSFQNKKLFSLYNQLKRDSNDLEGVNLLCASLLKYSKHIGNCEDNQMSVDSIKLLFDEFDDETNSEKQSLTEETIKTNSNDSFILYKAHFSNFIYLYCSMISYLHSKLLKIISLKTFSPSKLYMKLSEGSLIGLNQFLETHSINISYPQIKYLFSKLHLFTRLNTLDRNIKLSKQQFECLFFKSNETISFPNPPSNNHSYSVYRIIDFFVSLAVIENELERHKQTFADKGELTLIELYGSFDINNDDNIDLEEFIKCLEVIGVKNSEQVMVLFNRFSVGGKMNYTNFINIFLPNDPTTAIKLSRREGNTKYSKVIFYQNGLDTTKHILKEIFLNQIALQRQYFAIREQCLIDTRINLEVGFNEIGSKITSKDLLLLLKKVKNIDMKGGDFEMVIKKINNKGYINAKCFKEFFLLEEK